MSKILPLPKVKVRLNKLVDVIESRGGSITISRSGKPVAVIVSKKEYDGWQETVEILRDPGFMREIRGGIRALKRTKKRYTLDELFAD